MQDEIVAIIDSGTDICCLDFAFKITKIIRSTQGSAAYLSDNIIPTKFVQGVTTVLEIFGKSIFVCICVGFSSAQEREILLVEEELIRTGFSFEYGRSGDKPYMKSVGITLPLFWNGRVWGLRLMFPTPTNLQLPIPAIRLNHDYGDNVSNYMLEYSNSSGRKQLPVVRRVGKGWTIELLEEWKRRLGTVSDAIIRKTFANTTQLISIVEIKTP